MGQTTQQIEAHIEHTREDLGSNLNELERKVKSVTDWKQHFNTKPMTMLGAAFGGGILLATMLGGRSQRRLGPPNYSSHSSEPKVGNGHQQNRAMETWENIKGALIGVAATRFKDYVEEIVPGFSTHYQRAEEKAYNTAPKHNG